MSAVTRPPRPTDRNAGPHEATGRSWLWPGLAVLTVVVTASLLLGRQVRAGELRLSELGWGWVVVAALLTATSFLGAGWNLSGLLPAPIRLRAVVAAQVVASGARVVTPAGLGAHAVNLQLLRRGGADGAAAVGAVAGAQAVQLVVTVVLLLAAALAPGRRLPDLGTATVSPWVLAALLAVAVVVGAGLAVPSRRRRAAGHLRQVVAATIGVRRSPRRCLEAFGGAALLSTSLAGTMWACTLALGATVRPLDALVVVLVGAGVGSVVPTPGGTGGVETAMTAGLVAAGVPLATALPAVLLYRLLSLWVPVPVGLAAAVRLRAAGVL